jgi:uncharacterized membrane protein
MSTLIISLLSILLYILVLISAYRTRKYKLLRKIKTYHLQPVFIAAIVIVVFAATELALIEFLGPGKWTVLAMILVPMLEIGFLGSFDKTKDFQDTYLCP